jgi:ribonucleotide monophosphatase NagD (HAD superfamily)
MEVTDLGALIVLGGVLLVVFVWLRVRSRKAPARAARQIAVDGTNVLFWRDETALLSTLQTVLKRLRHEGFDPVVFLDASSRHHVGDRSLNERKFAHLLGLDHDHIMVVPAGTEADAFILEYAGKRKLAVVSNDRFRDRPRAARNIRLVKGRFEGKRLVLKGL